MNVIGAGFGRTGTRSLKLALEKIGLGKCYHMEELIRNPDKVPYWKMAMEGKPVNWDEVFTGYQSVVDFPASMYYKSLADYYPEAKIILSVRDPERWYESVRATIYSFDPGISYKMKLMLQAIYNKKARSIIQLLQLNQKSIWGKFFEGRFEDKAYAISKFNDHIETVKRVIAPERLLVHQSKDGWEPLCEFLNIAIPDEPYPRANKREDFKSWAIGVVDESLQES